MIQKQSYCFLKIISDPNLPVIRGLGPLTSLWLSLSLRDHLRIIFAGLLMKMDELLINQVPFIITNITIRKGDTAGFLDVKRVMFITKTGCHYSYQNICLQCHIHYNVSTAACYNKN